MKNRLSIKRTAPVIVIILLAAIIVGYLILSQQRVPLRPAFDAAVIERYENITLVATERCTGPGELDTIWDILSEIKMDEPNRPMSGSVKYKISLYDGDTLRDTWNLDNESVVNTSQFLGNGVDSSGAFEKVDAFFSKKG